MNSLKIETGEVRLLIDDDPERVIAFNPTDVGFIERFMSLYRDMDKKQDEIAEKEAVIRAASKPDANDVPENATDHIALIREVIDYMREQIDAVFGKGTSQTVFRDVRSFMAIESFLNGISPYVQQTRKAEVEKHLSKGTGKALK